jgi:hypothetical protein
MTRAGVVSVQTLSLVVLAWLTAAGCGGDSGGDSPTGPEAMTIADLVGSWKATSVIMTNQANPSQKFDIVAAGGELRMTVLVGGGARTWLDLGDFSDEWDAQLTLSGNQLTSTPVEASRPTQRHTITLVGSELTATNSAAVFDFTLSGGTPVPATQVVVFRRN